MDLCSIYVWFMLISLLMLVENMFYDNKFMFHVHNISVFLTKTLNSLKTPKNCYWIGDKESSIMRTNGHWFLLQFMNLRNNTATHNIVEVSLYQKIINSFNINRNYFLFRFRFFFSMTFHDQTYENFFRWLNKIILLWQPEKFEGVESSCQRNIFGFLLHERSN